jgi:16S rRNA (adenine1518-N6/adenine1519-N6)-dimethyltransferase
VSAHLRPRKSLGQNFLRDENICRKIIAAVDTRPSDTLLEIGPGEGALTKYLARGKHRLIVVDLDERVVARMREMFPGIEVLHEDFLDLDLADFGAAKLRVVGNIPYNITSPILFHLLDHRTCVVDATLMVQKEVARRLVGRPRTKEYGILSVLFQFFAEVKVLFDVSRNAFSPKPEVTSSVVHLRMLPEPRYRVEDEEVFRSMVRSLFGKRRKMLRSSLKYFCDEKAYVLPGDVDLTKRPEELSVERLAQLSNRLVEAARHS